MDKGDSGWMQIYIKGWWADVDKGGGAGSCEPRGMAGGC